MRLLAAIIALALCLGKETFGKMKVAEHNLLGVLAYSVCECSALDYVVVAKRDFYGGYLLVADVGGEGQRTFFKKIFGCTATVRLTFSDFIVIVDGVD